MADPAPQAMQQIIGNDGFTYTFPDNWTDEQVKAGIAEQRAKMNPPSAPSQPQTQYPGTTPGGMQPREGAPPAAMVPRSDEAEMARKLLEWQAIKNMGTRQGVSAATALWEHDPTAIAQSAESKGLGEEARLVAVRRAAGQETVIPLVEQLQEMVRNIPEDKWGNAFGPYWAQPQPAESQEPFSYKAWKAPAMTPAQSRAAYGNASPEDQAAWGRQNDYEHAIDVITEAGVSAMQKGQIANTDAKMNLIRDLLRRSMLQPTRELAMRLIEVAEDSMRRTFYLGSALSQGAKGSYQNPISAGDPLTHGANLYRPSTYFLDENGHLLAPEGEWGSKTKPVIAPPGMTPAEAQHHWWPGTWFITPSGPRAGLPSVVPGAAHRGAPMPSMQGAMPQP